MEQLSGDDGAPQRAVPAPVSDAPLATRLRQDALEEFAGQEKLSTPALRSDGRSSTR